MFQALHYRCLVVDHNITRFGVSAVNIHFVLLVIMQHLYQ